MNNDRLTLKGCSLIKKHAKSIKFSCWPFTTLVKILNGRTSPCLLYDHEMTLNLCQLIQLKSKPNLWSFIFDNLKSSKNLKNQSPLIVRYNKNIECYGTMRFNNTKSSQLFFKNWHSFRVWNKKRWQLFWPCTDTNLLYGRSYFPYIVESGAHEYY